MAETSKTKKIPLIPSGMRRHMPALDVVELMPRELVEELRAFIFEKSGKVVKVAAVDPTDARLRRFMQDRFGDTIEWFTAENEDVVYILKNYTRDFSADIERLLGKGTKHSENIVDLVNVIMNYALTEKASDIHVEPFRGGTALRFRIDGILHTMGGLPRDVHPAVIARFKILANLKIDEYRQPQDGRIDLENLPGISFRVSTVPTLYGEKIVLRILDDSHKDLSIRHLGFSEAQEEVVRRNIEKPFGMIVTSGPTGSGKTTTLYGLLDLLKKADINISTLEDPIEYALPGVNQIQINPRVNLTFVSGLRALLRQDPDVIMVGEIRDSETAVMASEAALTGHLVLTTVHTNDAPAVFTRFLEMKVEDFTVASTVNLVIAQRLVRKVCERCARGAKLDEVVLKKIKEREDVLDALKALDLPYSGLDERPFRSGAGCDACLQTGYSGRIGLFELLELNKKVHDLILEHAPAERIRDVAEASGFQGIVADGVAKALSGITTFDEVLRATKIT